MLAAEQAASALLTAQSQAQARFGMNTCFMNREQTVGVLLLKSGSIYIHNSSRHDVSARACLQAEANRQLQAEVDTLRAAKAAADAANEGHGREVMFGPTVLMASKCPCDQ